MKLIRTMGKSPLKLALTLAFTVAILAPAVISYGQGTTAVLEQLVKEANKEGKVLWYESSPEVAIAKVGAAFNKTYPGVKLEHLRLTGTKVGTNILVESQGGGPTADVGTSGPNIPYDLAEQGLLQKVNWQELGVDPRLIGDPTALETCASPFILVYNTKMLSEAEVPKTWDDLLNPKWKGKFGHWIQPFPEAILAYEWGLEKGMDYLRKLKAQEPKFKPSTFSVSMDVAAGEYPFGIVVYHVTIPAIQKGAPLKHVFLEPTPVDMLHSFIPAKSAHPNAAKLFMIWLHSKEGNIAYENEVYRANPNIQGTNYSKLLAGVKISQYPFRDIAKFSEAMKQMKEVMK